MRLYGVFVGINEYRDPKIRNLNFAAPDAQQFHKIVNERIAPDERTTWLLTNEEATKKNVVCLIGDKLAAEAQQDDIVLLYFSGHGSPETSKDIDKVSRYLIMHDTEYEHIFATGLDLEQEVLHLLKRIRSKMILVLIDSCFSGRAGGRTFEGPNFKKAGLDLRGEKGISLQKLDLGEGRVIMAACDDEEVAFEYSNIRHGVFTYQLFRVLTRWHGEAVLGIGDLYEQVSKRVRDYTKNKQHPVLNGRIRDAKIPLLIDS